MNDKKNSEHLQEDGVTEQSASNAAGNEMESPNTGNSSNQTTGDLHSQSESFDEVEQLKEQIAQQAEEVAAMKDAYIRAKAEEDNVRRRSEKEVANSRKFAVEGFAKELLSVRDSLAIAAALDLASDSDDAVKSMKDGVDITLKQLDAALAKFSVTEVVAAKGDTLDPNVHQAMSIVEAQDVNSGCIVAVIQTGFTMHERLLRPAMVIVAK